MSLDSQSYLCVRITYSTEKTRKGQSKTHSFLDPTRTGTFQVALVVKGLSCQHRNHKTRGFDPWVGKIPWRRKWQPTPVFMPGKSHGQRSLAGYSLWGCTESDMTAQTTKKGQL